MVENLIINACITGMIPTKARNPHTPVTPEEMIREAAKVYELGASILHLHARGENGKPTWEPSFYREIITGIRETTPEMIICVSTSGRLWNEPEKRAAALMLEDPIKPDMASLGLGSFNFPGSVSSNPPETILYLLEVMRERGIVPELEVFDLGMIDYARYLVEREQLQPPLYMNILLGNRGTADANRANLEFMVSRLPESTVWSASGIGKAHLSTHLMALEMNGHARVGIEDSLYIDYRTKIPASNAALIERLLKAAAAVNRFPMPVQKVRTLLKIGTMMKELESRDMKTEKIFKSCEDV